MLIVDLNRLARVGKLRIRGEISSETELLKGTGFVFGEPVVFRADAQWLTGEEVLIAGRAIGRHSGECRRCLKGVERSFDLPVSLYYVPADRGEVDAADVRTYDPTAAQLDLGNDLREEMMLALDSYLLCRPECKGLCPHCGTDLNENECACAPEAGDARWDALRALTAE